MLDRYGYLTRCEEEFVLPDFLNVIGDLLPVRRSPHAVAPTTTDDPQRGILLAIEGALFSWGYSEAVFRGMEAAITSDIEQMIR